MFEFLKEHEYFSAVNDMHPSYNIYKFVEKGEKDFIAYINVPKNHLNEPCYTLFISQDVVGEDEITPWFQEIYEKVEEMVIKRDRIRKIF